MTVWLFQDGGLGKLRIPLLSDITHEISKDYGVYLENQGIALRYALTVFIPKNSFSYVEFSIFIWYRFSAGRKIAYFCQSRRLI